jgi:branched-subunit amino acid ABC-type transport system permease component
MPRWFALTALLLLASCAPLDTEQVRLCRLVLPALHPPQTAFRETGVAATDSGSGVRIDYEASEPDNRTFIGRHWATCRFGGTALTRARLVLVGVDTDRGALSDVRLLYLNRFWLDAFAATADTETATPAVPNVPKALAYAVQQLVNAIALCAIYALLATAYALIYGLIGRLNLAFGEIAVVGAYGAIGGVTAAVALGLTDPIGALALAFVIAAALAALWSFVVGAVVVAPLHARFRAGQPILVATIAVAIAIQEFLRLSQGAQDRWLPPLFNAPLALMRAGSFVVTVTPMQIAVALIALAAAGAVLLLLAKSRFGREWRAFADDPDIVALFGVSRQKLIATTFVLAGLMAGLSGWIVAVYYGNVGFSMGTMLGLKALVAAVVGGIGSVPGAFLGGILVGLIEAAWSAYFDLDFRDIVVFSLMIVMFVLRPGGLLGYAGPSPRQV